VSDDAAAFPGGKAKVTKKEVLVSSKGKRTTSFRGKGRKERGGPDKSEKGKNPGHLEKGGGEGGLKKVSLAGHAVINHPKNDKGGKKKKNAKKKQPDEGPRVGKKGGENGGKGKRRGARLLGRR